MDNIDNLKRIILFVIVVVFPIVILTFSLSDHEQQNPFLEELRREHSVARALSADHSRFEALQADFASPHEITAACLSCHTERGSEVLNNAHWNWEREEYIEGRGVTYLGKKNLINNFCTGILSNERACNRCHIGYGWEDHTFDFSNQLNVDCLICHDNTRLYTKASGAAGYPPMGEDAPDFNFIAQNVGRPTNYNCGYCHFMGGGGNNVKHGDLEFALLEADRTVDVHMGLDGMGMSCVDCHVTVNHQMRGKYYAVSSTPHNNASCTDCHTMFPHTNSKINEHSLKVDCRVCHIPEYAKVNPTKMSWDWATAGQKDGGLPYATFDSLGNEIYLSEKGDFDWQTNVVPDYVWFNGFADHHLLTDKIMSDTININTLLGFADDPNSKIVPVKIHTGRQPYDTVHGTLIQAKLWGREEGEGAFWVDLDWDKALRTGMEYAGMPYSGNYGFVQTRMYLPVSHMVSPADQALTCIDCHHRTESRLRYVEDIYVPAMSYNATLNFAGSLLVWLSLAGVAIHAGMRLRAIRRKREAGDSGEVEDSGDVGDAG